MLSASDRQQKFEQLRAHWEAVDLRENKRMVGRRVKPMPQDGVHDDLQNNTGSKFRRKLSNGLALISLTQRKGAPARQPSSNASLAVSAPSNNDSAADDALTSTQVASTSVATFSDAPDLSKDSARASEDHQTPCALPRSRTFSYIPRPVKLDTEVLPAAEGDQPVENSLNMVMTDSKPHAQSRIPTPSPPQSKHRVSSPRQYLSSKPPLNARIATNRQSFTGVTHDSPPRAAVRSRTTPNLLKTATPQSASSFMAPRRLELKRPFVDSTPQKSVLVENVPTSERVPQRRPQVQERPTKRESMAVPSTVANRRSFRPDTPPVHSKRASFAKSVGAKRLSAHLTQTPVTAKRVSTIAPETLNKSPTPRLSEEGSFRHSEDLAPSSSPTRTLSTLDSLDLPLAPPPKLRPDAGNDTLRKTLGTPNGLGGNWKSSKVFATANYQVRRLPRSSTFHYFGRRSEAPPPVPPIPNQYKAPSSSNIVHLATQQEGSTSTLDLRHCFSTVTSHPEFTSRSLLSDIASTQRSMEAASVKSVSTSVSTAAFQVPRDADADNRIRQTKILYRFQHEDVKLGEFSKSSSDMTALPQMIPKSDLKPDSSLNSTRRSNRATGNMLSRRCWSLSQRFYPYSTDRHSCVQVKDYMPPLYWAGRFQSRFDQWRTEAMTIVLNPDVRSDDDGPLGQCSLDNEKKATILLFMQLRDLCTSAQAADSLHEFEYRYRKDHRLLDTKFDLSPSLRKPDDSTALGPIGRAVRRLTPRKASLVNLFKGKGWNRGDDAKAVDVSSHVRELQDIVDLSNERENEATDSFESGTVLHAR